MSERWPPMLGVVGFDGGYKSAVALAIPPEEPITEEAFVEPIPPLTDCSLFVTFNGIEFCCACDGGGAGGTIQMSEGGGNNVNGINIPSAHFVLPGCFLCQNDADPITGIHLLANIGTDCPPPDDGGIWDFTLDITSISGIWYVMVYSSPIGLGQVLFYGTTTDPSLPIPNLITDCTLAFEFFDNPLLECEYGMGFNLCSVGKNGTATLTF